MKNATLLFLVSSSKNGEIDRICLAMKKRGFGMGRWNGVGGKVELGESIDEAVVRETFEEIGVVPKDPSQVAELVFEFPHQPSWNQIVHVFVSYEWKNEPVESDEMAPQWFSVTDIPYDHMWPDDRYWLPNVLQGKKLRGTFVFGKKDSIQSQHVENIDSW